MLSIYDEQTLTHALSLPLDPKLHALLADRIAQLTPELIEMTHFLIVEEGDTEADLVSELGFCPIEVIDGVPSWDWLHDHGGWTECIQTVGNSGFAYHLFVQDGEGALPRLCRHHAEPRPPYLEDGR